MFTARSLCHVALVYCVVALVAQNAAANPQGNKMNIYSILQIRNAPYTVQLRDDTGKFFCAGAVLSADFVVTAADCVNDIDLNKITVVAAATTLTEEGVPSQVAKITIHPDYNKRTKHSNVAMLKLKESLPIGMPGKSKIVAPSLCSEPLSLRDSLQVAGWRHLSKLYAETENLFATRIPLLASDICYDSYHANTEYGIFCAQGNKFADQYLVSDIGSPALNNGELCGIAHSCFNCDQIDYTVAFTDLYSFRDFINEAMV